MRARLGFGVSGRAHSLPWRTRALAGAGPRACGRRCGGAEWPSVVGMPPACRRIAVQRSGSCRATGGSRPRHGVPVRAADVGCGPSPPHNPTRPGLRWKRVSGCARGYGRRSRGFSECPAGAVIGGARCLLSNAWRQTLGGARAAANITASAAQFAVHGVAGTDIPPSSYACRCSSRTRRPLARYQSSFRWACPPSARVASRRTRNRPRSSSGAHWRRSSPSSLSGRSTQARRRRMPTRPRPQPRRNGRQAPRLRARPKRATLPRARLHPRQCMMRSRYAWRTGQQLRRRRRRLHAQAQRRSRQS